MQSEAFPAEFNEVRFIERSHDRGVMGGEVIEQFTVARVAHNDEQQTLRMPAGLMRVTEVGILRHHNAPVSVRGGYVISESVARPPAGRSFTWIASCPRPVR